MHAVGNCVEDKVWSVTFSLSSNHAAHTALKRKRKRDTVQPETLYLPYIT